ncbi:hypothetical protein ATO67_21630 [Agrobacterium bohemicum]|uniref:Uncharacterized protein n=1 Tax=Agrobacterium bohemicum TaxID=2052828 RepID=A0A135P6F9_9HYPH|nr:hypothetical protein ATO67_21630 [Agrobacterium bohemicum]
MVIMDRVKTGFTVRLTWATLLSGPEALDWVARLREIVRFRFSILWKNATYRVIITFRDMA